MIKKCLQFGRTDANELSDSNVALISITDHGSDLPRLKQWADVLILQFDDISKPHAGYVLPSGEHAREIHNFIIKNWDRSIFAHCEAGVSRSAACAEILRRLGWTYIGWGTQYANPLLLRLLTYEFKKELGLPDEN